MKEIQYAAWCIMLREIHAERGYITNADIVNISGGDAHHFKRQCKIYGIEHPATITKYDASLMEHSKQLMALYSSSDKKLRAMQEEQAAIRRQTREPKGPEITGTQMSLF